MTIINAMSVQGTQRSPQPGRGQGRLLADFTLILIHTRALVPFNSGPNIC